MASLLPQPKQLFQTNTWEPLVGGQIFTYAAGTLTAKATFLDAGLTSANTNPVVVNARGEVLMYGDGAYRIIAKDSLGNTLYDVDNVESASSIASAVQANINLLRTDLASTADATKGDALLGVKRTLTNAVATTLHAYIEGQDINVKTDFGAKGDGTADDTPAIQSAINTAALNGKRVYFPAGVYRLTATVFRKAGVDLIGENMSNTTLRWSPANNLGGTMINTANESLNRAQFANLTFDKEASVTGNVTGILGGSTLINYNSAIACFENLFFNGIAYGILGNAEPTGVGIFDSYFKNIWCASCIRGLWLFGSSNRIDHPRITLCDIGIALDYLNAESFDGVTITGGTFVQNNYDLGIVGASGSRPIRVIGTWFEQAKLGIINIPNANTRVMNLDFSGCMFSVASTGDMFNVANAVGTVTVERTTLISGGDGKAQNFVRPTAAGSRLIVRDCQKYDATGVASKVSDFAFMATNNNGVAQSVASSTITKLMFSTPTFDSAGEFNAAASQYNVTVPGVYRVKATAGFELHSTVNAINQLSIYRNNAQEFTDVRLGNTAATTTVAVEALIKCAAGDFIDIRAFHNNAVAINVLGNNDLTYFTVEFVSNL